MSSTPQFGTAEYKSASGPDRCKSCQQELSGAYFRIDGLLACEKCTRQLQAQTPKDTHAAYVRGILFGVGGAIVGLILYSAFGIATGIRLGYIALAVGWLVGTAIKKGSNGIGGRRYQIAAVALTYAAVSLSAIPVGIYSIVKEKNAAQISHPPDSSPASDITEPGSASPQGDPPASGQRSTPSLTSAAGALLFAGLASPFLELTEGVSGLIGLVIIFVGIRIAWKMTGAPPLEILGPFQANAPPPPAPTV
jgi:membrane-associated phospholipid phosphatase